MNPYAGNPDSFPGTIPLPDDSDPPDASTFNPAEQGNADRTAALAHGYRDESLSDLGALAAIDTTLTPDGAYRVVVGLGAFRLSKGTGATDAEDRPAVVGPTTGTGRWFAQEIAKINYRKIFTAAATSWTCPRNIKQMLVVMCGAGGGGAGGASSGSSSTDCPGGGGGAGAQMRRQDWAPTPAHTYTIAAGQPANAAAAQTAGGDGGTSGIIDPSGPTILLEALGGQGGNPGTNALATVGSARYVLVPGGTGVFGDPKTGGFSTADEPRLQLHAQDGGYSQNFGGGSGGGSTAGSGSVEGGSGGAAGARGTNNTQIAGAGGGGGGGGPILGANGGGGGNGGDGTASGAGHNGVAGSDAGGTSYGAGGGGGGGAGAGSTGSSTGGAGGKGAGGIVVLIGVA